MKRTAVRLLRASSVVFVLCALASAPHPICGAAEPVCAGQETEVRWGTFGPDWRDHWTEAMLDARRTRYEVVRAEGDTVMRAQAENSASALVHELNMPLTESGRVSWRWRVEHAIPNNRREREKKGDDYAARLFVIFGGEALGADSEAICYVWAANEPAGSVYENPYVPGVATVVVQTGDERAGEWVTEERDLLEDFRSIFGRSPDHVAAVAIMVDTDDTSSKTTAWFDDIRIALDELDR